MLLSDIFRGALSGVIFLFILRTLHILSAPRGKPIDAETYEAGYYPLEPGKRPLKMQYLRRFTAFLAADGFIAFLIFLPYIPKDIAINAIVGLGIILAAAYKVK